MIRANLYQSCQPDGLTGLMAERSGYSARDREPGSLPRTSSRKRPFPVRDRRPRCCPRFDRGSAWCERYARAIVQGNGTLVPKSAGRWSGASGHHGWDARTRCLGAPGSRRGYPSGVTHRLHRRGPALSAVVLAALAVCTLGACATAPTASFDPTGPCTTDGRSARAYPELEARVPTSYEGRGPDQLDSGRHCTQASLGSLAAAGFTEVRFAGGTWDFGGNRAAALVVFQATDLTADQVADFYATSARAADRTRITAESTPSVAGRVGRRLDTTTGSRTQTVVVWPSADAGIVNIVITNDLPDPKIDAAAEAFGGH